jgi:primase-polymerase (primpol)-like protein
MVVGLNRQEIQMKSITQFVATTGVLVALLSTSACVSNGASTAQTQDDAWCSNHPKQCDNKDWCAKNAGKCATSSSGN